MRRERLFVCVWSVGDSYASALWKKKRYTEEDDEKRDEREDIERIHWHASEIRIEDHEWDHCEWKRERQCYSFEDIQFSWEEKEGDEEISWKEEHKIRTKYHTSYIGRSDIPWDYQRQKCHQNSKITKP